MLFRCDASGKLGQLKDTPGGGKVAPATFARVGILVYQTPSGPVREYTPPGVLQAAADALRDAPVTNLHPPANATPQGPLVTPANASRFRHGHVSGPVTFDGKLLTGEVALDTAEILGAVAAGRQEVSLGYLREVDPTPGMTPEGEPYDVVRTRIVPNHVAIVDTARAGRVACLKLDSLGNQILDTEESGPVTEEPMAADIKQLETEIAELKAQLKVKTDAADAVAALQPKLAAAEARADAAEAEVTKLKAEVAALKDPAKLDAAVTARLDLLGKARKVVGVGFKADGKTEDAIVREVAETYAKTRPSIKLDGKGADYVRSMFDIAVADAESDPEGHKAMARVLAPETRQSPAQVRTDAAPVPAWKQPLAAHK